jgi:uncharacterized protein (TIGR02444 family)
MVGQDVAGTGFWDFSLEIYGFAGVADASLHLQDVVGTDVNIALYCVYAGLVLGIRLDQGGLDRLGDAVTTWNEVSVKPLRAIRRALKQLQSDDDVPEFRKRVQVLELEAERIAQFRLAAALPPSPPAPGNMDLARDNLLLYGGDAALPLLNAIREGVGEASKI